MSSQYKDLPETGGGGITSINGDTSPAQLITGGTGISVSTSAGNTTITNTSPGSSHPGTTVVPDIVTWGDTTGTTLADSGVKIQAPTGGNNLFLAVTAPAGWAGGDNTIIGFNAGASMNSASTNGNTMVGYNAGTGYQGTVGNNVFLGTAATGSAFAQGVVSIGPNANGGVGFGVAIGNAAANSGLGVAIGGSSSATGAGQVSLGPLAGFSPNSVWNAANTLVLGGWFGGGGSALNTIVFGQGISQVSAAELVACTLTVSASNGSNQSAAAASFSIAGARGTGTGVGGDIIIKTAPAGGSGSTNNALVERVRFPYDGGQDFTQITTPSNPSASHDKLYFKSGDGLYALNSSGSEKAIAFDPSFTTISSNVTLAANSYNFVSTAAARSLTLPSPVSGTRIWIKDITGTASSNNISILRFASEKIENVAATKIFQTDFGAWQLVADGVDWWLF